MILSFLQHNVYVRFMVINEDLLLYFSARIRKKYATVAA